MLQHEKASTEMFDYLVKDNDLEKEMKEWKLDLKKDLVFIKEMIYGPLDTEAAQDKGVKEMMDSEKKDTLVSHAQVNCVKSSSIVIFTAANKPTLVCHLLSGHIKVGERKSPFSMKSSPTKETALMWTSLTTLQGGTC